MTDIYLGFIQLHTDTPQSTWFGGIEVELNTRIHPSLQTTWFGVYLCAAKQYHCVSMIQLHSDQVC